MKTVHHLERQVHRGQADTRKCLMSSPSQEPRASGKPAAMFSSGGEGPENRFKISVSKDADPANLGRSLLEGNEDHLLFQARSELMKKEHQFESLNNCIQWLQQQTYAQRLELQDAHTDMLNLDEDKFVARRMGSPRQANKKAAADPQGSRTCVCADTLVSGWHTQVEKGEMTRLAVAQSGRRGKHLQ